MVTAKHQTASAIVDSALLSSIVARLRKHEDAYPFSKPVEWKKLGLLDYPEIITKPMDLQTVGRQIRDGIYQNNVQGFIDALQLIWQNCKTYNDEEIEVYKMAERMEEYTKQVLSDMLPSEYLPADFAPLSNSNLASAGSAGEPESKRRRTQLRSSGDVSEEEEGTSKTVDAPEADEGGVKRANSRQNKRGKRLTSVAAASGDIKEEMKKKGVAAAEPEPSEIEPVSPPKEMTPHRVGLIRKFLLRCRRLTPQNMAKMLIIIQREQGDNPQDWALARAYALPKNGRKSQLLIFQVKNHSEEDLQRLCSLMKSLIFKQTLDNR